MMRLVAGLVSIVIPLVMSSVASANLDWTQVNISHFGDANNKQIELILSGNFLYAAVENELTGVEVWRYEGGILWSKVNMDGFGDRNNGEFENIIEFNDKLYIETNNQETGSEVWRYEGSTSWTRVDPGAPGPGNGSFGDINNCDYEFKIFDNKLYLSTENKNSGSEIWRYEGGTSWTRVDPGAPGPGNGGFENNYNRETGLQEFNGSLYATTHTWDPNAGVEVWKYNGGTSWEQINIEGFGDINNIGSDSIVFSSTLYVTTYNFSTGVEVWRYDSGTSWTQVNTDGFGNGSNNSGFESKIVYDGSFYIGTSSWNTNGEIWRYNGGTTWTDMTPPWDIKNEAASDFIVFNNNLYAGTTNTFTGGEVWEYDGMTWSQINTDGFGSPTNEDFEFIIYNNNLYAYTRGDECECKVWRHSLNRSQGAMPWIPLLLLDD